MQFFANVSDADQNDSGELFFGDIVLIKGLTSEKGRHLNGKKGSILISDEAMRRAKEGSTGNDTRVALNNNGRYNVSIQMSEGVEVKEVGPSQYYAKERTETYKLKRENLELIEGTLQSTLSNSTLSDSEKREMLRNINIHKYKITYFFYKKTV